MNRPHSDFDAFRETRHLAEAGQPKAQYNLGLMYANGVGTKQDFKLAIKWYHKAAENNWAPAQYILAGKYAAGQGVDRDIRQALHWYLRASDRGSSRALFKLGQMLSVPQEEFAHRCFAEAAEKGIVEAQLIVGARCAAGEGEALGEANVWYQKAAENGYPAAQYLVGTHYHHGKGVAANIQEAVVWYRKAARQGFAAAQSQLGLLYLDGEGVPKDNRQALSWLSRAAEQGDLAAQYQLAQMYEEGLGVAADPIAAETWYMKAADQGDMRAQLRLARLFEVDRPVPATEMYQRAVALGSATAQCALGQRYASGEGIEADREQALTHLRAAALQGEGAAYLSLAELMDRDYVHFSTDWYQKAAEAGLAEAQCIFGKRLSAGQGVAADWQAGLAWLMRAAEQGHAEAQHAIAEAYYAHRERPESLMQAIAWYRKAAKQGYAQAQSALAGLYARGEGVPKDNRQAASWWLKAAEQGDATAQYQLGRLFESGGGATADKYAEQWYRRAIERNNDPAALNALLALYARTQSPEAEQWFIQGAKQGIPLAQAHLAETLSRRGGAATLTHEVLNLLLQAAAKGEALACRRLADWARQDPQVLAEGLAGLAHDDAAATDNGDNAPDLAALPLSTVKSEAEQLADCRLAAEQGDPRAQWTLASLYAKGSAVQPQDLAQAAHWYRQGAVAGFPAAQSALALMLATGQGGQQNNKEACHWWTKAARQGDAEAQYNLALMYEKGLGVAQSFTDAAHWFEQAARAGIAVAQTRLGLTHAMGRLGAPDYVEAYAWFAVAAAGGHEAGQANRDHAESLLDPAQKKEARRRAETLSKELKATPRR